jgi:uncharacterized NAD(P)/FAD-binding protein YdhS
MVDRQHVAIVGGAFSGAALAVQLLARGSRDLRIALIEAGERFGRGAAYGTDCPEHLLNTRADRMSLLADEPEHFVRWCRGRGMGVRHSDFVQRRVYGDYVEQTLMTAATEAAPVLTALPRTRVAAVARARRGFELTFANAGSLEADAVVLATGHPLPRDPLAHWLPQNTPRFLRDPWRAASLDAIQRDDSVLLLGTGLTMVDTALTLAARGHRARIDALSRRGLLPRPHASVTEALPRDLHEELERATQRGSLRCMLRAVRCAIAAAESRGLHWQCVIDALRTRTPKIWTAMDARERRSFVERVRPYWDVHRHRLAPSAAERLDSLRASGQLLVRAGGVRSAAARASAIDVEIEARDLQPARERYCWIVNCTGPTFEKHTSRGVERQLLESRLLIADPLGLGYLTTLNGTAVGARGPTRGLYLLGPACRPRWWEQTAVPELRQGACTLAEELIGAFDAGAAVVTRSPQRLNAVGERGSPTLL